MILVLEDDFDRVEAFRAALADVGSGMNMLVWSDAHAMIREIGDHLAESRVISLDHDLCDWPPSSDVGDGLDVAKYLVTQPIVRPVIVHSSNGDRARCMMGEFELAGWPCQRVVPFGEGWVEKDWMVEVLRFLKLSTRQD